MSSRQVDVDPSTNTFTTVHYQCGPLWTSVDHIGVDALSVNAALDPSVPYQWKITKHGIYVIPKTFIELLLYIYTCSFLLILNIDKLISCCLSVTLIIQLQMTIWVVYWVSSLESFADFTQGFYDFKISPSSFFKFKCRTMLNPFGSNSNADDIFFLSTPIYF